MPKEFLQLAKGDFLIPVPVLIALFVLILALIAIRFTRWGRYTLTIGSNCESLRRLGIHVGWQKVTVYALSGLLAGISTLIVTARLNTEKAAAEETAEEAVTEEAAAEETTEEEASEETEAPVVNARVQEIEDTLMEQIGEMPEFNGGENLGARQLLLCC